MFNLGISKMGDILEIGVEQGIIKKSGAFYSYGETRLGQGRENSKEYLAKNPDIAGEIESRIRGSEPAVAVAEPHQNGTGKGTEEDAGVVSDAAAEVL